MTLRNVIVVGAGMAGLVCARRLQAAGYQVSVLEKSRGVGGRLATRRLDGMPVDHGARFVEPTGERLQRLTDHWVHHGMLTLWRPHTYYLDSTGQLNPDPLAPPYYVAPAGMSAIGKTLAAGLTVHRQQRVVAIAPTADHTWLLTTTRTDDGTPQQYRTQGLVLALPAPQIGPLLAPLRSHPAMAALADSLALVAYAPCITVMAHYTQHSSQADARLPCLPQEPWMIEGHSDTPFFWVGLDSGKRQVEGLNVVLHSSATFAEHWLETPQLQPAGEALLASAGKLIAPWLAQPARWQVHRWRYARVETPNPHPLPTLSAPAPLVACGDWCGDRHLDTALEAGWAAAAALNDHLANPVLNDFPQGLL
jgi:renalase